MASDEKGSKGTEVEAEGDVEVLHKLLVDFEELAL